MNPLRKSVKPNPRPNAGSQTAQIGSMNTLYEHAGYGKYMTPAERRGKRSLMPTIVSVCRSFLARLLVTPPPVLVLISPMRFRKVAIGPVVLGQVLSIGLILLLVPFVIVAPRAVIVTL